MRSREARAASVGADRPTGIPHALPQPEPGFPEPEAPPATPSAPCRRSGTRAGVRCCPTPLPPLAETLAQAHTLPSSLPLPYFTSVSRGPALAPDAPRGTARAARRRGRGLTQGAPGLASGGKGRDRPRRKQRARSPGAVPARSLSLLQRYAVPTPVLFVVVFVSLCTAEPLGQFLPRAPSQRELLPIP